jgi:hypothetical protein
MKRAIFYWSIFILALFAGLASVTTDYKTLIPPDEYEKCGH